MWQALPRRLTGFSTVKLSAGREPEGPMRRRDRCGGW
jgi:hypothetical protein